MRRLPVVVLGLAALALAALGSASSSAQDRPATDGVAPTGSGSVALVASSAVASAAPTGLEQLLLGNQLAAGPNAPRDPFGTSVRMLERAEAGSPEGPRFVPGGAGAVPKLSLRGYVEPRGKAPVALVEIEGQGVYVVRAGDTIGLTVGGKSTVLKVQAIEASSARIEAGSLGQVIVVR